MFLSSFFEVVRMKMINFHFLKKLTLGFYCSAACEALAD